MESKAPRWCPRLLSEGYVNSVWDSDSLLSAINYNIYKMKRSKKINIMVDLRWSIYDDIKKSGDIIKANKFKREILDSYKWKKPCHHVSV